MGHDGRAFLSIRRQGTEPEDEYPGAAGLHEQDVRCAQGQGWKYEKKDFGSTSCSLLTPPPGDANSQFATICGTVVKEMLVMTSASSKPSVPMEKLKTLTESAAARLP